MANRRDRRKKSPSVSASISGEIRCDRRIKSPGVSPALGKLCSPALHQLLHSLPSVFFAYHELLLFYIVKLFLKTPVDKLSTLNVVCKVNISIHKFLIYYSTPIELNKLFAPEETQYFKNSK